LFEKRSKSKRKRPGAKREKGSEIRKREAVVEREAVVDRVVRRAVDRDGRREPEL
jgi:hypothetical protein